MGINQLIHFLVVAEECRNTEELVASLEKLLKLYRFDYYGLMEQSRPGEGLAGEVLASHWPEGWFETYVAKKYLLIDPTMRYLTLTHVGFRWRDALASFREDPHYARMERMVVDSMRFGLLDGYLFPIHGRTGLLGSLTVGGRPVDLSPVEMSLLDACAQKVFWRMKELKDNVLPYEPAGSVDVSLTRRELEVLNFLANGMTSNEISKLLKISAHTVDWYTNGLQEKLRAKNRQHAVAIACRLGLVL